MKLFYLIIIIISFQNIYSQHSPNTKIRLFSQTTGFDSIVARGDSIIFYNIDSIHYAVLEDLDSLNELIDSVTYDNDTLKVYEGKVLRKVFIPENKTWLNNKDNKVPTGIYDTIYRISPVSIGNDSIDNSAILELSSSNKGFLPPRLTQSEIDLIISPAEGLMVYNLTDSCINYYSGIEWLSLCGFSKNAKFSFNCSVLEIKDSLKIGDSLNNNDSVMMLVNVNKVGLYSITANFNKYTASYSNSGSFTSTGLQNVILYGNGFINNDINDTISAVSNLTPTNNCVFIVDISDTTGPPIGSINPLNCNSILDNCSLSINYADYNLGARVINIQHISPASTFNDNLTDPPNNSWTPQGSLISSANENDPCVSERTNTHSGFTSGSGGSTGKSKITIDLQSIREIDLISLFQMNSDGITTHIEIETSLDNINYTFITSGELVMNDHTAGTTVQPAAHLIRTPRTNARYIRLTLRNDGSLGSPAYIEFRQIKVFKINSCN